jgi:exo-beta-1,3-glucanase (GH17 family)
MLTKRLLGAPDSATTTSVTSTTYTTVTVVPTESGSAATTWGSWDPSASSSPTTSWESWDPSSSSSPTTSWSSWADGASASFYTSTTSGVAWSTSSAAPSGGSGNAAIAPAGSLWAITYSPYTASGGCKDAGSIASDITDIKSLGFTTVRIYSTDCSGLENVGSVARSVGLKLILGVFIESSGVSGAQPQVSEIVAWAQWDLVEMIIIGNEALFNNYLSVSDLTGFISSSKSAFSSAGYTGPVTTTEPLDTWIQDGSSLCSSIDVVAANIHAFFNAQTSASQAGAFIESELQILDGICPGKATYVVESGWPHAGQPNGAAIPGPTEQATALASIQSTCGSQVVFFTYEDDLWKAPGAFGVEQSWGCADVFRNGTAW